MSITWMPEAVMDLRDIQTYIAKDDIEQSFRVIKSIEKYVNQQLVTFPLSGRRGRVTGTRELVVPRLPYFVPYRLLEEKVEILRIYHTSRLLPQTY